MVYNKELLNRAMALCDEIELKQAELRAILGQICDNDIIAGQASVESSFAEEKVCPEVHEPEIVPVVEAAEPEIKEQSKPSVAVKHRGDIRKAFTINDRFRFRRELFAGDDNALSAVIDHLASLETLAEADSYLSTMPWDSDSEALSEFMTIVANHFNGYR